MFFVKKIIGKRIITPVKEFLKDSRAVGITLLACTLVSLILANTNSSQSYIDFWNKEIHTPVWLALPHTYVHWINDFLMAFFFFLVGMEIKRELLVGELSSFKKAVMPVAAAIGGMLVPALIYTLFNYNTFYAHGWGIPMATDIAFSLGVASLLGKRVPAALKIFLMALAIIDDLGAILVIALFYGGNIDWLYLLVAGVICLILWLFNYYKLRHALIFIIAGLLLWYCIFNSGIHATIAGVLLAMFIPVNKLEHYIHGFHDPVNFVILPLFALANTAIAIPGNLMEAATSSLSWGIITGLLLGKPIGITLLSWITVKLKWGTKPKGAGWPQLFGIGLLAGIGFTMSIFIAMLAFNDPGYQNMAKIAVLIASVLAIILGIVVLRFAPKRRAV